MKRPSVRALAVGAVALVVLVGFGWVIATQGPMAPVRVTTASVQAGTLAPTVFGIGTVEARRAYSLGPTAAGRVLRVLVDEGDRVSAGQLLAEMDPIDLDLRIEAARAANARAAQSVAAARAQLAEADSRTLLARSNVKRYEQLHAQQFVSVDAVEAKRHEARATAAAEEAALAMLAAAQADAQRTAADLDAAQRQRGQLRLLALADGVVAARHADPGTTLVAGQGLLQVVDPASLWVRARIDQGRAAGIAVGQAVEVVLRSQPERLLSGRVERLGWISDAVTEERIIEVALGTPPAGVSIGELAEVTVRLPVVADALVVPSAAVKRSGGRSTVWRYVDGRAQLQSVTTGVADAAGRTQIVAGLDRGDAVVVYSQRPLAEGLRVKVVPSLAGGG